MNTFGAPLWEIIYSNIVAGSVGIVALIMNLWVLWELRHVKKIMFWTFISLVLIWIVVTGHEWWGVVVRVVDMDLIQWWLYNLNISFLYNSYVRVMLNYLAIFAGMVNIQVIFRFTSGDYRGVLHNALLGTIVVASLPWVYRGIDAFIKLLGSI